MSQQMLPAVAGGTAAVHMSQPVTIPSTPPSGSSPPPQSQPTMESTARIESHFAIFLPVSFSRGDRFTGRLCDLRRRRNAAKAIRKASPAKGEVRDSKVEHPQPESSSGSGRPRISAALELPTLPASSRTSTSTSAGSACHSVHPSSSMR